MGMSVVWYITENHVWLLMWLRTLTLFVGSIELPEIVIRWPDPRIWTDRTRIFIGLEKTLYLIVLIDKKLYFYLKRPNKVLNWFVCGVLTPNFIVCRSNTNPNFPPKTPRLKDLSWHTHLYQYESKQAPYDQWIWRRLKVTRRFNPKSVGHFYLRPESAVLVNWGFINYLWRWRGRKDLSSTDQETFVCPVYFFVKCGVRGDEVLGSFGSPVLNHPYYYVGLRTEKHCRRTGHNCVVFHLPSFVCCGVQSTWIVSPTSWFRVTDYSGRQLVTLTCSYTSIPTRIHALLHIRIHTHCVPVRDRTLWGPKYRNNSKRDWSEWV